jgi:integrase
MAKAPTVRAYPRKNGKGEITGYRAKYGSKWLAAADGTSTWPTEPDALKQGWLIIDQTNGPREGATTVRDFYEKWIQHPGPYTGHGRASSTIRHNTERAKKFAADHGDKLLTEITRPIARQWVHENAARGPAVRVMFNDAFHDDYIPSNPFTQLKNMIPKKSRKGIHPLTPQEITKLADSVKAIDNPKYRTMFRSSILFAAYSGLRQGEQAARVWDDIDFADGWINVATQWRSKENEIATPKGQDDETGEGRRILLFPVAAEALWAIRNEYGTEFSRDTPGLIFTSSRGARLGQRNHFYYWSLVRGAFLATLTDERVKQLGRNHHQTALHWHDLRHFTASWLLDQGNAPRDVAEQLGHTDGGQLISGLYGHTYTDNALDRLRANVAKGGNGLGRDQRRARREG